MKTITLLFTLFASAAHAQSPAPAKFTTFAGPQLSLAPQYEVTGQVRILGRGMRDRKTDELLALACVGENHGCDQVQWIYTRAQKNYFVGQPMQVCESADQCISRLPPEERQALKKALKKVAKAARSASNSDLITGGILVGSLGSTALIASLNPIAGVVSFGTYAFLFLNYRLIGNIGNGMTAQDYTLDQNGMNWSSNARKVGHRYFSSYLEIIVGDAAMNRSSLDIVH